MAETHYSTDGPICPFCGHVNRPDDPHYWDESTTELDCGDCDSLFPVRVYVSTSWTTARTVDEL